MDPFNVCEKTNKNDLADKTGSCRPWGWQAKDMVGHFYCSQLLVGACRRSHLCLERERGWVKMGGWEDGGW